MIPVFKPRSTKEEADNLVECIESNWISSEGPFVKSFENDFSSRVGRKYGVAVNSGTSALELAIKSLKLEPGDEVILPAFTIIACLNAVYKAGLKPVLADVCPRTFNITATEIEKNITPKTKAVLIAHMYGLPCDMDPIIEVTRKYQLKLLEDAAEVHGQTYRGTPCGSFGDVSIFSFYANKIISTGEGGMVVTNNENIEQFCRDYRNQCFSPGRRFVHHDIGHNFRMTNLQAAVGQAQLKKLESMLTTKKAIGERYLDQLEKLEGLQLPEKKTSYAENVFWVVPLILKNLNGGQIDLLRKELKDSGVDTRPFFWPLHLQPAYTKLGLFQDDKHPHTEFIAEHGLYLPSGPAITEEEIDYVSQRFSEIYKRL